MIWFLDYGNLIYVPQQQPRQGDYGSKHEKPDMRLIWAWEPVREASKTGAPTSNVRHSPVSKPCTSQRESIYAKYTILWPPNSESS